MSTLTSEERRRLAEQAERAHAAALAKAGGTASASVAGSERTGGEPPGSQLAPGQIRKRDMERGGRSAALEARPGSDARELARVARSVVAAA